MTTTARRLPRFLLITLAVACGGDAPTSTTPPGTRLVLALAEQPVEPGDVIPVSATLERPRQPPEVIAAQAVTWSVDRPASARMLGGSLELLAAGPVELRARYAGVEATLAVVTPPAIVASISVAEPSVSGMLAGGEWALDWTARTTRGRPLPAGVAPAFTTSDASVVEVDGSGRLRARGPGSARVRASGAVLVDDVDVTVLAATGDLPLASADSIVLTPGRTLRLRGSALAGASVTVNGVTATTTVEGDTVVRLVVPDFDTGGGCAQATTATLAVAVAARRVSARAPARAPMRLALAPGGHAWVGDSLAAGCELQLAAGTWLVMPYRWDRAPYPLRADTLPLALQLGSGGPVPAAARAANAAAVAASLAAARASRAVAETSTPATVGAPGRRGAAVAEELCRAPQFVGDSMYRLAYRHPDGTYGGSTRHDEWWYLIRRGRRVDVVADTGFRRVHAADSLTRANLDSAIALYDDVIAPALDASVAEQLPDRDGNGRMIVFVAHPSSFGASGGGPVYQHAGCASLVKPGESIFMGGVVFTSTPGEGYTGIGPFNGIVMMHEAAHTYDLAPRYPGTAPLSMLISEGVATFATDRWILAGVRDTLGGNHFEAVRTISGYHKRLDCTRISIAAHALSYDFARWRAATGYPIACNFLTFALARGRVLGRTMPRMLSDLSVGARGSYGESFATITGLPLDPRRSVGEWMLSWYADDLPGAAPEVQQPMWRLRQGVQGWSLPWTPTMRLGAGAATVPLLLGEPDAKWIEIEAGAAGTRLSLDGAAALRAQNGDVILLRVR